jgi:hypothetical protein
VQKHAGYHVASDNGCAGIAEPYRVYAGRRHTDEVIAELAQF